MKKILYSILMGGALLFTATSCENEVEDNSVVTYYVDLQLKGEKQMWVEVNTPFEDPGFTATENGEDVASKVEVEGEVESDKIGYYVLNYSAVNKDGFSISDSREVFVYDPSVQDDYSGTYTAEGKRTTPNGTDTFSDFSVEISLMNQGFYSFSDFLGGYYESGKGYGEVAALKGYASIGTDKKVTGLYSFVQAWGDSATSITGTVESDGTIKMVVVYGGMTFEYKLTKAN